VEIKTDLFINETDMKKFISKGCCGCLVASVTLFIVLVVLVSISERIWPEAWGFKDLGNGLCLMDFDGGPIIVKGSIREMGGSHVIPLYEDWSNEHGIESVADYKVSDDWIIVKTRRKKMHMAPSESNEIKFYIVDKRFDKDIHVDSISANYVTCYTDSLSFVIACKERGVDVSW
jgi:hypothetical protein